MEPSNKMLKNISTVKEADIHLFRIGLCLTSTRVEAKRSLIHKPIVQFVVLIYGFFKYTITLLIPDLDLFSTIVLGDFSQFVGIKLHFNIACNFFIILALSSQLVYFYNYINDIKPTFLNVFEVMSGSGLKDGHKLMRRTKRLSKAFLAIFWSTMGCFNALFMYFLLFSPLTILLRIAITYALVIPLSVFLFIIFTASSVNAETDKTHRLLIPLVIPYYSGLNRQPIVNTKRPFNALTTKLKVISLIERIGDKRIGFWCWKLFLITDFRCYEIIALIAILFLKVTQILILLN
ncbi:unnamed protein product [Medioppia subpectinata]|uniref:Uncharacterized protein n=1 Tax=Medioppia subpectinata TaxID=1979941 RepID=A0A7R9KL91_9ACAR|nr:unnamed protein product [Medioppia subpectinata]CAG2105689.1 unnamed protein product [Medioppia subpectinata]